MESAAIRATTGAAEKQIEGVVKTSRDDANGEKMALLRGRCAQLPLKSASAKRRLTAPTLHHSVVDFGVMKPYVTTTEAGSNPCGHNWVTWGVYLCAGKPPLAHIILSHPRDLP